MLRSLRLAAGLTLREFAKLLGVAEEELEAWEHGTEPFEATKVTEAIERLSGDGQAK